MEKDAYEIVVIQGDNEVHFASNTFASATSFLSDLLDMADTDTVIKVIKNEEV